MYIGSTKAKERGTKRYEEAVPLATRQMIASVSLKTTSFFDFVEYVRVYGVCWDVLWAQHTSKTTAREKFRVYRLQTRFLDRFWQKIKKHCRRGNQPPPLIAYGAGFTCFPSNGPGEPLSAPTHKVYRSAVKINGKYPRKLEYVLTCTDLYTYTSIYI